MAEEYKSVHTGPDIDAAVSRALPGGAISQAINAKPNPNLLDNAYFVNPVNQRGQTEYTGSVYGIDRWRGLVNTNVVSITNEGVVFSGKSFQRIAQQIETPERLNGKIVTISALVKNQNGSMRLNLYNETTTAGLSRDFPASEDFQLVQYTATPTVNKGDTLSLSIYPGGNDAAEVRSCTILAIKLELGSEQTLAHQENGKWVLNEIPNYAEELAKCQNYYRIFNAWTKFYADYIDTNRIMFSVPGKMRANPAVGGNFKLYSGVVEISGFTFAAYDNGNNIVIVATKENHGLTSAWLGVSVDLGTLDANL